MQLVLDSFVLLNILGTIITISSIQDEKLSFVASTDLSCLDEDGKATDWFIAYKFPEIHDSSNVDLKSGYAYGYILGDHPKKDHSRLNIARRINQVISRNISSLSNILYRYLNPQKCIQDDLKIGQTDKEHLSRSERNMKKNHRNQDSSHWIISDRLIKDENSIIFNTLRPAFKKSSEGLNENINLIFYNDQPPSGGPSSNDDYAHSKGVVLMDDTSKLGIWLTHSTPRFPPQHLNDLKFEKNAAVNGQTFMCVTFDLAKSGEKVAKHLATMKPQVYDSRLSEKLLGMIPEFRNLKTGLSRGSTKRRTNYSRNSIKEDHIHQTIETYGGQQLNLFSKSRDFQRDLYADWIVNELDSDLFVETWRNGGGSPLNSSCPLHSHKVNNVSDLKIDLDSQEIDWHYTHDHSKWAISQKENPGYVCVGDINRMHSQFRRGGGIMCISNGKGWNVFRNTIQEIESC